MSNSMKTPIVTNLLLEYIDARIDEKIEEAFGRDALNESVRVNDAKDALYEALDIIPDEDTHQL